MFRRISVRVAILSTALVLLAMAMIATVVTNLHREAIERRFDELIALHAFNLVTDISLSSDGTLIGSPDIGDLRYSRIGSGWYWQVTPASDGVQGVRRSFSNPAGLTLPGRDVVPLDENFQRRLTFDTANGEELRVLEREVAMGDDARVALFTIAASTADLRSEVESFRGQVLAWLFSLAGIVGLINTAAIIGGLKPLGRARENLVKVRSGELERLDGQFPAEIKPLADEINALLDNNRAVVVRARTQVGDLAHSLKTPLSVIVNEARGLASPQASLIQEQAGTIRQQIDRYLQKARIAAQRGGTAFRCDVVPAIDRMVRVFGKLAPHLQVSFKHDPDALIFAGEAEDFEELLGNLLENAANWAKSRIMVSAERDGAELVMTIEDDGPGIPVDKREEVLARGKRLDESKPGTGLGLAIVADLVKAYDGHLALSSGDMGGLKCTIRLPAIASSATQA